MTHHSLFLLSLTNNSGINLLMASSIQKAVFSVDYLAQRRFYQLDFEICKLGIDFISKLQCI